MRIFSQIEGKKTFTISEAAQALRVSIREVEQLIRERKLDSVEDNGLILTSRDAIEDYLLSTTERAPR